MNDTGCRIYSSTAWQFNTLEVHLIDRGFTDINPVLFGSESFETDPDRRATSVIYDCFLMHYVSSGCGTFISPRGTFPVRAGQCFIIRPMEIIWFRPERSMEIYLARNNRKDSGTAFKAS